MGLLNSIREVLGIGSRGPGEAPARRPPDVTYRAELVGAQHEGYESVYLSTERQAELLAPRADGLPPLHLVRHAGALWLAEDTTGKLINVDNRYLRRLGIFGVKVRGTRYYTGRARLGPAALVREPDNPPRPQRRGDSRRRRDAWSLQQGHGPEPRETPGRGRALASCGDLDRPGEGHLRTFRHTPTPLPHLLSPMAPTWMRPRRGPFAVLARPKSSRRLSVEIASGHA